VDKVAAVDVWLDPMTRSQAVAILDGVPPAGDRWADDYPVADELDAIRHFLDRGSLEPHPFGLYVVRSAPDGVAIGGAGFFGPPGEDGGVEVGYGIVPSMRSRGVATAALRQLLRIAAEHGARLVRADTSIDNVASVRVMEKAGLRFSGRSGDLILFEVEVEVEVDGSGRLG
jgi:RimJ/RimL family protein N-acetyltransferase